MWDRKRQRSWITEEKSNRWTELGWVGAMIRARDQLLLDVMHELPLSLKHMRVAVRLTTDAPPGAKVKLFSRRARQHT